MEVSQVKNILILDDDVFLLKLLTELLRNYENLYVFPLSKPDVAMDVISSGCIDVAFIDLHLGEYIGLEFIREAKHLAPGTKFVVITGDDGFRPAEPIRDLRKPLSIGEILKEVRST